MASRKNPRQANDGPRQVVLPRSGVDPLGVATLVGVVVVLMISFSNLRALDTLQDQVDDDFERLEDRIAQAGKAQIVAEAAPAATPPAQQRRGVDPDRVYTISTQGVPTKGAENAPITIAEFSDFQ